MMNEFEEVALTFCCNDTSELPIISKSDSADESCEILEFNSETAGPGRIQGTELNPVAASTHVTFNDTLVELKEQPSIAI